MALTKVPKSLSSTPSILDNEFGVDITGTITADGLTVDGAGDGIKATIGKTGGTNLNIYADTNTVYLAGSPALSTAYIIDQTNNNMQFKVNAAERMRLDASGNLGIAGQTNPTYKLDGGFADQTWGWYLNSSYNAGFTFNTTERSLLIHTKSAENIDHIKFATSSTGAERMRIDASGQVKVGTTGPTWDSTFGSFVTKGGFLASQSTSYSYLGGQAYYDGAFKRLNANAAELYEQSFGNHIFYNAISGAADSTITWNERMRLDASGNLGIGTSLPSRLAHLYGISNPALRLDNGTNSVDIGIATSNGALLNGSATNDLVIARNGGYNIKFGTNGNTRATIDANGRLVINGAVYGGGTLLVKQKFDGPYGGLVVESLVNDHFLGLSHDSVSDCFVLSPTYNTTGAYKPFAIHTSNIERLRVDTSGNLLVGTTSSLNGSNFQVSTGSGASSTPYASVLNTAISPTAAASTRFDLGFLSGVANYVATNTVLGVINFMGQANDAGYGGASIRAIVRSGGNTSRTAGHSVDIEFATKSTTLAGATTKMILSAGGTLSLDTGGITAPVIYASFTGGSPNMYITPAGVMMRVGSSLRYKNTVNDATHGLTELLTLRPVTYKGNNDGDTIFGGLIAEEVHDAGLTEFVQYGEDGEPDGLGYGNMVSLCIKAIQEQQAIIQEQQALTAALTARIEELENK